MGGQPLKWGAGAVEGGVLGSAVQLETGHAPVGPAVHGVVPRSALFRRLGSAARVTEVSAPAGSGKTLLLRSWIAESGLAGRAAWVTVQPEERDPQRLWIAVADALRGTDAGSALVQPLTAAPNLSGWAIVERLLHGLGRGAAPAGVAGDARAGRAAVGARHPS